MTRRPVFPISLHVLNKNVVLVGRGPRVTQRRDRLVVAGARVLEVAPEAFEPSLCHNAFLVMAHTDDEPRDRAIAAAARAAGCLCYVHDQPALSDFSMPAVATRRPLQLAISTEGTAPTLARRVRQLMQAALDRAGDTIDALLEDMIRVRAESPPKERRHRLANVAERLVLDGHFRVRRASSQPSIDGASEP